MSGRCLWLVWWNSTSSRLCRSKISPHSEHVAKCSFSSDGSFSYSSSVLVAPLLTVYGWRRQTRSRAQHCQSDPECESRRCEGGRGFPHSQLPDLSQETPVQRRMIQKRTNPTCEALLQ